MWQGDTIMRKQNWVGCDRALGQAGGVAAPDVGFEPLTDSDLSPAVEGSVNRTVMRDRTITKSQSGYLCR